MIKLTTWLLMGAIIIAASAWDRGDEHRAPDAFKNGASPSASSTVPEPAYGDMMVIGVIQDATVLLPVLAPDVPSHRVTDLILNGLVRYDKNVNLIGDLAERWGISEDQKTIRFFLRKGVKWHDGKPFTARDVEFTCRVYMDPKTPTPYASHFLKVKEFGVIDAHTVEVTYHEPYAPALASWQAGMLPAHLLEAQDITRSTLQRAPVGTGPSRFVEWIPGGKMVLEANPDCFRGRPYISGVVFRVVLDRATSFPELKAGNLDWAQLTPLQFKRQTCSPWFRQNFRKYSYLNFGYTYPAYNLQDCKFRDKRVRQAVTMGIDRESIVESVLMGMGQVAHTPYNPATNWHNPKVRKYPYNPEGAKRLLAEAGWKIRTETGSSTRTAQDSSSRSSPIRVRTRGRTPPPLFSTISANWGFA